MNDVSALNQQMRWAGQESASARAEIDRARAQMLTCEEEIARLRRELTELEDFRIGSSGDLSRMADRADERRFELVKLDSTPNVSAFQVLSEQVKIAIDSRTKYEIEQARSEIARQVNLAVGDIQREIDALKARIGSLEQAIAGNQALIAQNDLSIARLTAQIRASI